MPNKTSRVSFKDPGINGLSMQCKSIPDSEQMHLSEVTVSDVSVTGGYTITQGLEYNTTRLALHYSKITPLSSHTN